jgi:peptidyl-prolyl cis-trans isomerase B (cyclophilin B)
MDTSPSSRRCAGRARPFRRAHGQQLSEVLWVRSLTYKYKKIKLFKADCRQSPKVAERKTPRRCPLKRKWFVVSSTLLIVTLVVSTGAFAAEKNNQKGEKKMTSPLLVATMQTTKGDIRLNLFPDKAPVTVLNFVNLSKRGYYNGLKFHRVIPNFMIQGGCPLGTGTGGPGYQFKDEFSPDLRHNKPGIFSMANAGPNTNGSQFFITHVPTPWLDNKHTIFGEVISEPDQKVVNSIVTGDKINAITIEGDYSKLAEQYKDQVDRWNKALPSMGK